MIAIDWGTSSLRAYRLNGDGAICDLRRSTNGVLACAQSFDTALLEMIEGWDDALIVMSGMIGSRQGWQEVPYLECPAGLDDIAGAMTQLSAHMLTKRTIWIVPGLTTINARGHRDVMRGEETQIVGAISNLGNGNLLFCLPGTHSKHVEMREGRVESFQTAMTGEMFELLCKHSLLGRLMHLDAPHDSAAFLCGVDDALEPGDLLTHLFAVRANGLFGLLSASAQPSYLSGLLIGHELNDLPPTDRLHLIGSSALIAHYEEALDRRRIPFEAHDDVATARGIHVLAACRGLL
jgi:2-dehydro-3-deoxygalactonokinase